MASEKQNDMGSDPPEDGITRHYDRKHRLSRASPEVLWLVQQYDAKRPGLFKSLVATRSLQFMFFAVLLFLAAGGLLSFLYGRQDVGLLEGQQYKIAAFRFGESIYITFTRETKVDTPYRGEGHVTAYMGKKTIAQADFMVGPQEREEYRLVSESSGDGGRITVKIETNGKTLEISAPVR